MTSKEFNKAFYISAVALVIWGAISLVGILGALVMGELNLFTLIGAALEFMAPAGLVLYALKTKEIYPQMGLFQRITLTSRLLSGCDKQTVKYFNQIWRRSLLVVPMIKELMDDKRTLELKEAATSASESPKFADL